MYVNEANNGDRCETCRFAQGSFLKYRQGPLFCHRFPPTLYDEVDAFAMPEVHPKAWCGEFKPR